MVKIEIAKDEDSRAILEVFADGNPTIVHLQDKDLVELLQVCDIIRLINDKDGTLLAEFQKVTRP